MKSSMMKRHHRMFVATAALLLASALPSVTQTLQQQINDCAVGCRELKSGVQGDYQRCVSECYRSSSTIENQSDLCPAGRVYAGDARNKAGKVIGAHCVKEMPASFPPQEQGIPITHSSSPGRDSAGNPEEAADPYVSPGSVAPSSATDDLLNPKDKYRHPGCKDLIDYRDHKLKQELEVALTQRELFITQKEEEFTLAKQTLDLMSDQWWVKQLNKIGVGVSGGQAEAVAEIATDVRFVTDEVKVFISMFIPAEGYIDRVLTGRDTFDAYVNRILKGDPIDTVDVTIGLVRTWKDDGSKEAVKKAGKALAWHLGDELNPIIAGEHGYFDFKENSEGLEKFREITQQQVGQIVQSARKWNDKAVEANAKAELAEAITERISEYCSIEADQQQDLPSEKTGGQGVPIGPPR